MSKLTKGVKDLSEIKQQPVKIKESTKVSIADPNTL
jgi:hypothetical protein